MQTTTQCVNWDSQTSMLELIKELADCLSIQQKKVLRKYLTAFARRGSADTLLLKLFDLVVQHEHLTLQNAASLLYQSKSTSRAKKLGQRLYIKILDSTLIDINTTRLAKSAEHKYYVLIRVKKMLLQYYVLSTTPGGRILGQALLRKVYQIAARYEFYSTNQEVLPILKAMSTGMTRVSQYNYWEKCIRKNERAKAAYQNAFDLFNRYQELTKYQGKLSSQKQILFLEEAISTLSADFRETGSPTCAYFCGVLQTALYEQQGQFNKAIATCKSLIELLRNNVSIRQTQRLAFQYSNIAIMEFQLGRLAEALGYLDLSIASTTPGSLDEYHKLRQKVEILFYQGAYIDAQKLNSRIQSAQKTIGEVDYAITRVVEAVIYFKQGEFRQALLILNQKFALSTDKAGWELTVRILTVMTLVELGKPEQAEKSFHNLDRYVHRNYKEHAVTLRDKEIIKLLRELVRCGFIFAEISQRAIDIGTKLSTSSDTEWKYGTPELIPVDEWFLKKIKKKRGPKPGKKTKSNA